MPEQSTTTLPSLFEQDETAWLEQTADLVAQRRFAEIDTQSLTEYLNDMARRDKREVFSRLVILIAHLLKWDHQPDQRSNSWRGTILSQRRDLQLLLESGTLRRYAKESLAKIYKQAVEQAATESGLDEGVFPAECPMSPDEILVG